MKESNPAPAGSSVDALVKLKKYTVITFPNSHSVMNAEETLKRKIVFPFLVMPVPRTVSAGCGLAIKLYPDNCEMAIRVLTAAGVNISGVYVVSPSGSKRIF